jgi:5-methylcytosine-specific restriction endonuclease McrBC regulatory subunit McrC
MLEPEVKASIVYSANEWATFIMKQEKPGNTQKAFESYMIAFEKLYGALVSTVSPAGQ